MAQGHGNPRVVHEGEFAGPPAPGGAAWSTVSQPAPGQAQSVQNPVFGTTHASAAEPQPHGMSGVPQTQSHPAQPQPGMVSPAAVVVAPPAGAERKAGDDGELGGAAPAAGWRGAPTLGSVGATSNVALDVLKHVRFKQMINPMSSTLLLFVTFATGFETWASLAFGCEAVGSDTGWMDKIGLTNKRLQSTLSNAIFPLFTIGYNFTLNTYYALMAKALLGDWYLANKNVMDIIHTEEMEVIGTHRDPQEYAWSAAKLALYGLTAANPTSWPLVVASVFFLNPFKIIQNIANPHYWSSESWKEWYQAPFAKRPSNPLNPENAQGNIWGAWLKSWVSPKEYRSYVEAWRRDLTRVNDKARALRNSEQWSLATEVSGTVANILVAIGVFTTMAQDAEVNGKAQKNEVVSTFCSKFLPYFGNWPFYIAFGALYAKAANWLTTSIFLPAGHNVARNAIVATGVENFSEEQREKHVAKFGKVARRDEVKAKAKQLKDAAQRKVNAEARGNIHRRRVQEADAEITRILGAYTDIQPGDYNDLRAELEPVYNRLLADGEKLVNLRKEWVGVINAIVRCTGGKTLKQEELPAEELPAAPTKANVNVAIKSILAFRKELYRYLQREYVDRDHLWNMADKLEISLKALVERHKAQTDTESDQFVAGDEKAQLAIDDELRQVGQDLAWQEPTTYTTLTNLQGCIGDLTVHRDESVAIRTHAHSMDEEAGMGGRTGSTGSMGSVGSDDPYASAAVRPGASSVDSADAGMMVAPAAVVAQPGGRSLVQVQLEAVQQQMQGEVGQLDQDLAEFDQVSGLMEKMRNKKLAVQELTEAEKLQYVEFMHRASKDERYNESHRVRAQAGAGWMGANFGLQIGGFVGYFVSSARSTSPFKLPFGMGSIPGYILAVGTAVDNIILSGYNALTGTDDIRYIHKPDYEAGEFLHHYNRPSRFRLILGSILIALAPLSSGASMNENITNVVDRFNLGTGPEIGMVFITLIGTGLFNGIGNIPLIEGFCRACAQYSYFYKGDNEAGLHAVLSSMNTEMEKTLSQADAAQLKEALKAFEDRRLQRQGLASNQTSGTAATSGGSGEFDVEQANPVTSPGEGGGPPAAEYIYRSSSQVVSEAGTQAGGGVKGASDAFTIESQGVDDEEQAEEPGTVDALIQQKQREGLSPKQAEVAAIHEKLGMPTQGESWANWAGFTAQTTIGVVWSVAIAMKDVCALEVLSSAWCYPAMAAANYTVQAAYRAYKAHEKAPDTSFIRRLGTELIAPFYTASAQSRAKVIQNMKEASMARETMRAKLAFEEVDEARAELQWNVRDYLDFGVRFATDLTLFSSLTPALTGFVVDQMIAGWFSDKVLKHQAWEMVSEQTKTLVPPIAQRTGGLLATAFTTFGVSVSHGSKRHLAGENPQTGQYEPMSCGLSAPALD